MEEVKRRWRRRRWRRWRRNLTHRCHSRSCRSEEDRTQTWIAQVVGNRMSDLTNSGETDNGGVGGKVDREHRGGDGRETEKTEVATLVPVQNSTQCNLTFTIVGPGQEQACQDPQPQEQEPHLELESDKQTLSGGSHKRTIAGLLLSWPEAPADLPVI